MAILFYKDTAKMEKVVLTLALICGSIALAQIHQESFCGVKVADQNKTCISIRLPWQVAPIYFCTEKVNIPFKDRCTDQLARYCPTETSNTSLLVATPWDCCTLSSTPDICADRSCPSAPYNRTCKEVAPDSTRPWECCPTFFCDEDQTLSTCQMKRLEPSCMSPPKGKKNCIAFKDEHGCCNKFQCEGEGKPGMCPMQVQAIQFRRMMERENTSPAIMPKSGISTTSSPMSISTSGQPLSMSTVKGSPSSTSFGTTTTTRKPQFMDKKDVSGGGGGFPAGSNFGGHFEFGQGGPITTDLRCVGDFNCPGQMKCCSPSMSAYYDYANSGGRSGIFSSKLGTTKDKAIYGQCVEPVMGRIQ